MDVSLQTIVGIERRIGIFNDLLQLSLVDAGHLVGVLIVLMIGLVEINLCQESGSGSLGGTAFVGLLLRQHIERLLEVVDNQLPTLVVRELTVRQVVVLVVSQVLVDNKRDMLIQTLQQEVTIGTQELHLGQSLLLHVEIALVQQGNGTVHTRETVIQAYPHVVDVPVGGEHTLLDFQLMEHVAVARTRTALVGIVGTNLKVPHRERGVDIFCRGKDGIR